MKERFDLEFRALLDRNNPDTRSIWTFVERTLHQYEMDACGITAGEVLNEAYSRGVRHILEKKQPIVNPLGWIRLAAHNIIREYSRSRQRCLSLETVSPSDSQLIVAGRMESLVTEEEIELNIRILYAALEQLKPREREILIWRHMNSLTWCEVGQRLIDCGEGAVSETTLRQQGSRALTQLRKLFHTLKLQDPEGKAA